MTPAAQIALPTAASLPLRVLESALLGQMHPYAHAEARSLLRRLLDRCCALSDADWILNPVVELSAPTRARLVDAVERLNRCEPIQYVLGETFFAGAWFRVTPDVLIPRPETEEWVTFLQRTAPPPESILDIGTGSGCIALALKKHFPTARVEAVDCSQAALRVARGNGQKMGVSIEWLHADVLTQPLPPRRWSWIVSNPPYVRVQEKKHMHPRVLDYEPHLALFVADEDPLIFYRRIVQLAGLHLAERGTLCVEINEAFGQKIVDLLHRAAFNEVALHRDFYGKARWVVALR